MVKWRFGNKKKDQGQRVDLEATARAVAARLERVQGWIASVKDDDSPAFYAGNLISNEHLLALRDILDDLPGHDEPIDAGRVA